MSSPRVAIVLLSWNRRDDTLACLASLHRLAYDNYQVVLVDNGSTDGSVAAVESLYGNVQVIETGSNLGFAAGNNVGLRYALELRYDYALLLNNDTEVAPDFLQLLVNVAEADPGVGVVGPTIYYYDRPDTIWSAGGLIDWRRGSAAVRGLDQIDRGQFDGPSAVDFVSGCAMLCRRSVLEKAGLLDERFFMYFEETEWCVRVTRAGFRIVHAPQAQIYHKIAPVEQAESPLVHYYMVRNRLLFLLATHAGSRAWINTLLLDYTRTLASWSLRPKWRSKRGQRNVTLRAIADFFRGHFGSMVYRA